MAPKYLHRLTKTLFTQFDFGGRILRQHDVINLPFAECGGVLVSFANMLIVPPCKCMLIGIIIISEVACSGPDLNLNLAVASSGGVQCH